VSRFIRVVPFARTGILPVILSSRCPAGGQSFVLLIDWQSRVLRGRVLLRFAAAG